MRENVWSEIYIFRDISSSTRLDRCSGLVVVMTAITVVSLVSFQSFRLAVSGFSTRQLEGCNAKTRR